MAIILPQTQRDPYKIQGITTPKDYLWTKYTQSVIIPSLTFHFSLFYHHYLLLTTFSMSKSCLVTGKKTTVGNHVSHSNVKVKRKLFANLQKKRLMNPATGRMVTVVISARGLRTLKKWDREGKKYNLAQMKKEISA